MKVDRMARKRSNQKSGLRAVPGILKGFLAAKAARPMAILFILGVGFVGLATAGARGLAFLDQRLDQFLLARSPHASIEFVNLPEGMVALAGGDLRGSVADLLELPWTEPLRCEEIARRLSTLGWIESIESVQRNIAGRFEVVARYRIPVALVKSGRDEFVLVDGQGVRLPGVYVYHERWYIVEGVDSPPSKVGDPWAAPDLQAGLALLVALRPEPYRNQIAGINVANFAGRKNPRTTHLELITDRPGGRIRWGSAPGYEVEENLSNQKLALLRQNFAQTGRVDAGHPVIDISTFPDRFHIPG